MSKKHHYIPRFYLKGFCKTGTESLVVHEKGSTKCFPSNINDAGHRNHLHSFVIEGGKRDTETIEKWLCEQIEDPAAPVFEKIARREEITSEEKEALVSFVAVAHSRVPQFREDVRNVMAKSIQMLMDMYVGNKKAFYDAVKRCEKDTGEDLGDPEELRKQIADNLDRIGVAEQSTLPFIVSTLKLVPLLMQRNIRFICAPAGSEFIASDNPFMFYNIKHDPKNFYSGHGLAIPTTEIYFPLNATTALNLSYGPTTRSYAEASASQVIRINEMIVGWANSYIYSSSERPDLMEVISKSKPGSVMGLRIS